MHELFSLVLGQKDLSKAGDLFSLDDKDIENDLSEVLKKIKDITDASEYLTSDNDQSVVEICITRVTSAIRENGSIERHAIHLVALLETCLKHNLKPTNKDEDPPHAKIASDVMSCIFLNYSKKAVMELALPVAVKFLQQNNKELCRNLSSYLSLAAIDNCRLLAKHITPILQSIITGNLTLSRVLPQIYSQNKEPIQRKISALTQLLLHSNEPAEKNSLLQLCGLVAKDEPQLLVKHIPQFCEHLSTAVSSPMILQMFVDIAQFNAEPFLVHTSHLRLIAEQQPATLPLIAQLYGHMGRTNKKNAKDCSAYLVSKLGDADNQCVPAILQEVYHIGEIHPSVLSVHMPKINQYASSSTSAARAAAQKIKELLNRSTSSLPDKRSASSQTEGIVTVIRVGNPSSTHHGTTGTHSSKHDSNVFAPRGTHLSINAVAQLTHSKNASTSTREINFPTSVTLPRGATNNPRVSVAHMATTMTLPPNSGEGGGHFINMVPSGGISRHSVSVGGSGNVSVIHTGSVTPRQGSATIMTTTQRLSGSDRSAPITVQAVPHTVIRTTIAGSKAHSHASGGSSGEGNDILGIGRRATVTTTASSTASLGLPLGNSSSASATATLISSAPGGNASAVGGNACGVSAYASVVHKNAIPFRDAVQHFCEKHLDKIKHYIDQLHVTLPLPIKATLEETKHKKHCKLHFICFGQDDQCLYSNNFFTHRTKHYRTWIHIMFLAIQARSQNAVSQQDPSVGNLKACWDGLKTDSGNSFLRLVTSNFPSKKDQEALASELHDKRFFDIFEFNSKEQLWQCFMCQHPEKATGLMKDGQPSMEGQLKEKKGKWKFLKRWKKRHFTLTGMNITYNKKDKKASLPVTKIQSVKTIRKGARDIPKAFEIFTKEETYILKAKDSEHAEKWIQCLQIAVARTKSSHEKVTDFDIQTWDFDNVVRPQQKGATITPTSASGIASSGNSNIVLSTGVAKKIKASSDRKQESSVQDASVTESTNSSNQNTAEQTKDKRRSKRFKAAKDQSKEKQEEQAKAEAEERNDKMKNSESTQEELGDLDKNVIGKRDKNARTSLRTPKSKTKL